MTKFLLDTGAVDSIADSVKDISNNARDVMRSVSKYDVSNEDNFNFESAKDAISTNVQSAYIKFRLTNQYLKKVVTTHTELQESVSGGGTTTGAGGGGYSGGGFSGGYYGGSYGGGSGTTFKEESVTSPSGTIFKVGTISLAVLKKLLEDGEFTDETIEKLNKTNEKVLVITISKSDDNYKEKIELAKELSKVYDINLIVNEKEEKDVETKLSIVKNGIVLASTTELTDIDAIKKMFDKVNIDVEDENVEIEALSEEDEEKTEDKEETGDESSKDDKTDDKKEPAEETTDKKSEEPTEKTNDETTEETPETEEVTEAEETEEL